MTCQYCQEPITGEGHLMKCKEINSDMKKTGHHGNKNAFKPNKPEYKILTLRPTKAQYYALKEAADKEGVSINKHCLGRLKDK